jgi:hypothetical protein
MRTNILHQAKIEGCGKGLKGRFDLRSCCKIPHAHRFSNSRIMLIWIIAALLAVNLS